jgi:hypothetical protein
VAQESDSSGLGIAVPERDFLADFPFVIEGELSVPLDYVLDRAEADTIFAGFQYLLLRELRKREPGLVRLYAFTFRLDEVVAGSRVYKWKIFVKLKQQVSDALFALREATRKPEIVVALLGLTFAIPPAIESFEHLIKKEVAPAAQAELHRDNLHAPPQVIIITVRPPNASERSEEDKGDHLPDGFST